MDYQNHPEYLPITVDTLSQITLKTALENSLADICGVNFHLLYPSGNLTALVEIKPANQAYKEKTERLVYEKFPEVEQVGFIYTENGQHILEMTGNEMCVNATLCYFHLCFLREKKVTNIFVK
jgi:diaminopimelate epimerase